MPFLLSRGAKNNVVEVQRWQYFLLVKQGISLVGSVDGGFGALTEQATRIFQIRTQVTQTGKLDAATLQAAQMLGYTVVPDDHYDKLEAAGKPPAPAGLASPDNLIRNRELTCFRFRQLAALFRDDPDGISILGSCDGRISDWEQNFIRSVPIPELAHLPTFRSGRMRVHERVAAPLRTLIEAWRDADLLHLFITFDGSFVPRYKRGKSPGSGAHGIKDSVNVSDLSNHAFGSAFDINADWNPLGEPPAEPGRKGCVYELVAAANKAGWYWGGRFSNVDGMHFEFADF